MAIYSLQPVACTIEMIEKKRAGLWLPQPVQEGHKEVKRLVAGTIRALVIVKECQEEK